MPNPIKYSTGTETLALKKGNFYIGTGAVGKGPTSETGYYNGITPPTGGYTIYLNKETGGPSIYTASNDAELISLTNSIAGQSYTGAQQCFDYYYGQTDKVLVNQDYPVDYPYIVMDGLILNLDAGITQSYPGSGTSWTDINGLGPKNNTTLVNGPTFSSDGGGSIVFDGSNDYTTITLSPNSSGSICFWFYYNMNTTQKLIMGNNSSMIYCGAPAGIGHWYNWTNNYTFGFTWTNTSQWIYMCATHQSTTSNNFYLNGNLKASSNSYSITKGTTYNVAGGIYNAQNCKFAMISTYNRELSAAEVLQNYNATKGRFGL